MFRSERAQLVQSYSTCCSETQSSNFWLLWLLTRFHTKKKKLKYTYIFSALFSVSFFLLLPRRLLFRITRHTSNIRYSREGDIISGRTVQGRPRFTSDMLSEGWWVNDIYFNKIDDITFHPGITRSEKESKRTKNLEKSEEFQIISKNTYVGRIYHSKVPPMPFFLPRSTFFLLPRLPPLLPFFLPFTPRFSFAWNWISNFSFSNFTISSA